MKQLKLMPFFLSFLLSTSLLISAPVRIMPLGDSITYDDRVSDYPSGRSSSVRTGYRSHLWYALQDSGYSADFVGSRVAGEAIVPAFDPHNEGHPGWTSYEVANNVFRFLSQNPADVILLHTGTNDGDFSVSGVEDILDEIDLYEEESHRFIRVIVALIIDKQTQDNIFIEGFNHNLNNLLNRRILRGDGITIVNMATAGLTSADYADHTHPSDAGYQKMAQVWFDALIAPYNIALHSFPTTLVSRVQIRSITVDEDANNVTFITDVPDSGITF